MRSRGRAPVPVLVVVTAITLCGVPRSSDAASAENAVSPILGIEGAGGGDAPSVTDQSDPNLRSIDGSGNNLGDPAMGAAGTPLRRWVPSDYGDGISSLAGSDRPGPREISNVVSAQDKSLRNGLGNTDYLWLWGQFVDHDISLTDGTHPPEPANIQVPTGDPYFDPEGTGTQVIPVNRSIYDPTTGKKPGDPRQQINQITAWIDASNVYGSDPGRAAALRTNDGTGRLKTSAGNLLPFNTAGLPNAGGSGSSLFLAGDVRANEHVGLIAMHTLFVREHNRLAALIAANEPELSGDAVYERARRIVGALMQAITYREFLPALLGPDAISPYGGYDPTVDARPANVFTTAAYRFGHSAVSPILMRLDADGKEIPQGNLRLREAFFAPHRVIDEGGIEPLLRGFASQPCQTVDPYMIDDMRNFLFGPPGAGGFDLAAINIQRGRDHGLPAYNATRIALGFAPAQDFSDISSDHWVKARLAGAYVDPDSVDLWSGGLAEDPAPGAHVGPLFATIIAAQFEALRDGDRLWYARTLTGAEIAVVEATRLSDIIRRNTQISDEIPDDVFLIGGKPNRAKIK